MKQNNSFDLKMSNEKILTLSLHEGRLLFLHAEFLSSQIKILNSTFSQHANTVTLNCPESVSSIKIELIDREESEKTRCALLKLGLSEVEEVAFLTQSGNSKTKAFSLYGDDDESGSLTMQARDISNKFGHLSTTGYELSFPLNGVGISLMPNIFDQGFVKLGITSTISESHASILFSQEQFSDLELYWKELGFPMHRMC